MRLKPLLLLLASLGCGLVASIGISEIVGDRQTESTPIEVAPLLVARSDIDRRAELSPAVVAVVEWPKAFIPDGALTSLEEIEGRRPLAKINSGLPILRSMLGGMAGASEGIPDGFRAVAVRVTEESGAGMIKPGDRVDVQVYAQQNAAMGIRRTGIWTFLQDITVFAVDSTFRNEEGDDGPMAARTISLLVTPKQAARVTLASETGRIRLVMRNGGDTQDAADGAQAGPAEIFGSDSEKPVVKKPTTSKPVHRPFRTTIFRGIQQEIHEFEDESSLPERVEKDGDEQSAKQPSPHINNADE